MSVPPYADALSQASISCRTHRNDSGTRAHGPNIEHEHLSFAEFLNLALLLTALHVIHSCWVLCSTMPHAHPPCIYVHAVRRPSASQMVHTTSPTCMKCKLHKSLCRLYTCVRTPSSRRNRKKLISSSVKTSGSSPTSPRTCPTSLSALVNVGSTCSWQHQAHHMQSLCRQDRPAILRSRACAVFQLWWTKVLHRQCSQVCGAAATALLPCNLHAQGEGAHSGSDTNQASRHSILQVVLLC